MRPAIVQIPQPCAESWDAMTPTAAGRHCAACQKTVIDFTQLTDEEVVAHFRQADQGGTCGRFRAAQLGRPLQPVAPATTLRWRISQSRAWATLAFGIWLSRETAAPAAQAQTPTEQRQPQPPAYLHSADSTKLRLRGIVIDSAGLGVPGATVLLAGTSIGVATAVDGTFDLVFPARLWQEPGAAISFSLVGYHSALMPLPHKPSPTAEPVRIVLKADTTMLSGEVVITGGACYRKPWPWHPRRFWFWLSRPFRR